MRILILGGTGFTGPFQVAYAVQRGHHVTVFNRGRRQAELPAGVEHLQGARGTTDPSGRRRRTRQRLGEAVEKFLAFEE